MPVEYCVGEDARLLTAPGGAVLQSSVLQQHALECFPIRHHQMLNQDKAPDTPG